MSAKVVLSNSVVSDMSGSFLLMMLLLVVRWITATHFSGATPSSIYTNYSASKIVQPELYLNTSRYTSITPELKKLHWLPVEQRMVFKTATLVYKFLHTGFPTYFAPYLSSDTSSYSTRCSQSGGNFLVPFQSSTLLAINLSNSLVIVLHLVLPLCGMLFQMRFVPLQPWLLLESSLKPTYTPKHTHLRLNHPLVFSVVLEPLLCLWILKFELLLFWFCCALESSCMGRLITIKVQLELCPPPWGVDILFLLFPPSDVRCPMSCVRCPASRMVSAHLKEKY